MKIGNIEVTIDYAEIIRTTKEDCGSVWIAGTVTATATHCVGGREISRTLDVPCGCWDDCDDDREWSSSHEGARVIAAVLGRTDAESVDGCDPITVAFSAESAEIGTAVCKALCGSVARAVRCGQWLSRKKSAAGR